MALEFIQHEQKLLDQSRTKLTKPGMSAETDLLKYVSHCVARLDLAPVSEEEVHLHLSHVLERCGE
jgi:hypothetical protein